MAALVTPRMDDIQKPAKSLDSLLGEVMQPSKSRLSVTMKLHVFIKKRVCELLL